jgi:hypothetical protein
MRKIPRVALEFQYDDALYEPNGSVITACLEKTIFKVGRSRIAAGRNDREVICFQPLSLWLVVWMPRPTGHWFYCVTLHHILQADFIPPPKGEGGRPKAYRVGERAQNSISVTPTRPPSLGEGLCKASVQLTFLPQ